MRFETKLLSFASSERKHKVREHSIYESTWVIEDSPPRELRENFDPEVGPKKMVQLLRPLDSLAEDLGFIPCVYMLACKHP